MLRSWKHTVFLNSQPSQTWWIQQFKLKSTWLAALNISIHQRKPSFESQSRAEKSPWRRVACVTPSWGHRQAAVAAERGSGHTFPLSPTAAVMGMISCLLHACMHFPASQHTAIMCSAHREEFISLVWHRRAVPPCQADPKLPGN